MLRWIFVLLFPFVCSAQLKRFRFTENKMGSPFNLVFYVTDSAQALAISKECFAIVDSLNNIFSDYSLTSEVGRLAQQPVGDHKISDELFSMIVECRQAWKQSGKTFDVTIGSLTQLWRKVRKED